MISIKPRCSRATALRRLRWRISAFRPFPLGCIAFRSIISRPRSPGSLHSLRLDLNASGPRRFARRGTCPAARLNVSANSRRCRFRAQRVAWAAGGREKSTGEIIPAGRVAEKPFPSRRSRSAALCFVPRSRGCPPPAGAVPQSFPRGSAQSRGGGTCSNPRGKHPRPDAADLRRRRPPLARRGNVRVNSRPAQVAMASPTPPNTCTSARRPYASLSLSPHTRAPLATRIFATQSSPFGGTPAADAEAQARFLAPRDLFPRLASAATPAATLLRLGLSSRGRPGGNQLCARTSGIVQKVLQNLLDLQSVDSRRDDCPRPARHAPQKIRGNGGPPRGRQSRRGARARPRKLTNLKTARNSNWTSSNAGSASANTKTRSRW